MSIGARMGNCQGAQCVYKGQRAIYTEDVSYSCNRIGINKIKHTVFISLGKGWIEIPIAEAEKEGITEFGNPTTFGERRPRLEWNDLVDK